MRLIVVLLGGIDNRYVQLIEPSLRQSGGDCDASRSTAHDDNLVMSFVHVYALTPMFDSTLR